MSNIKTPTHETTSNIGLFPPAFTQYVHFFFLYMGAYELYTVKSRPEAMTVQDEQQ